MFEEECVKIIGKKDIIYQFRLSTTYALSLTISVNITRNLTDYMKYYNTFYAIGEQSTESIMI